MYHVDLNEAEIGLLITLCQEDCLPGGVHREPTKTVCVATDETTTSIEVMWKLIHARTGTPGVKTHEPLPDST